MEEKEATGTSNYLHIVQQVPKIKDDQEKLYYLLIPPN